MTEHPTLPELSHEASYEELWFKLRHVARIERISEGPGWRAADCLDSCVLIAANRDDVPLTVDGRSFPLKRGAVCVGAPGQRVCRLGDSSTEVPEGYALFFDIQGNPSIEEKLWRQIGKLYDDDVLSEAISDILLNLCEKAYHHWHRPSGWEKFRSQAAFQEIIYHMLDQTEAAASRGLDAALEQIKLYLELHYGENPSLEQLAEREGISPRHFRRAFKLRFGISATEYVTELRMSQAKQLLAAAKQPVAEIARQVGYQDESYFRRTFKHRVGISPANYVRNRQLRIAACSFPNIGQLLPLSIIPFAAPIDHDWTDVYRRKYRSDVQYPLHHHNEVNCRTLAAAKPDCILSIDAFSSGDIQRKLGEIAPLLAIPWYTKDWREHLLLAAAFLNRTKEAESWLAAYDSKADNVCRQWNRMVVQERVRIVMVDRHRCYRWMGHHEGRMDRHEFPFAPARHKKTSMDPAFEPIELGDAIIREADRLVLLLSEDRHSQLTWQTLPRSVGWLGLQAVRENRVQPIMLGPWFEYTAFNHGAILDQVAKALL